MRIVPSIPCLGVMARVSLGADWVVVVVCPTVVSLNHFE